MTSRQRRQLRSSWKLAPATRRASTGGEVPVDPDRRNAQCGRRRKSHHRTASGSYVRRVDARQGGDA